MDLVLTAQVVGSQLADTETVYAALQGRARERKSGHLDLQGSIERSVVLRIGWPVSQMQRSAAACTAGLARMQMALGPAGLVVDPCRTYDRRRTLDTALVAAAVVALLVLRRSARIAMRLKATLALRHMMHSAVESHTPVAHLGQLFPPMSSPSATAEEKMSA